MNSEEEPQTPQEEAAKIPTRPTFLAKLFGFAVPPGEYINGSTSHLMTSDGIAEVNVAALIRSKSFKNSAAKLKKIAITPPNSRSGR